MSTLSKNVIGSAKDSLQKVQTHKVVNSVPTKYENPFKNLETDSIPDINVELPSQTRQYASDTYKDHLKSYMKR